MAAEKHSEPTMRMDIKICLPQLCTRIRHVWIWENFQTTPEGPREGLKDSQIAYPCISVVAPLPKTNINNSWIKARPRRGQLVKLCETPLGILSAERGGASKGTPKHRKQNPNLFRGGDTPSVFIVSLLFNTIF